MENITLIIEGMTCSGCVDNVKRILEKLNGVDSVKVSLSDGIAEISFDPQKTNKNVMIDAIENAGFDAS